MNTAPPTPIINIELFSQLPADIKNNLLKKIEWQLIDAGANIILRDENDDRVFFIGSGSAQVVNYSELGRMVSFATLMQGDCFGELSAIDGKPRSASVITKTECLIGTLLGEQFIIAVTKCEKTALKIMQRLANIIRIGDTRIESLSLMSAEQKICALLLTNLKNNPDENNKLIIDPLPTQNEIASNTGVTQNTVARIFTQLYNLKVIIRNGNAISVLNLNYLENVLLSRRLR
jgi:CRP/FNR family cyclic AMP-dependent transcriptional regulator